MYITFLLRIAVVTVLLSASAAYSQYSPKLVKAQEKVHESDMDAASALLKTIDTLHLKVADKALYAYLKAKINVDTDQKLALQYFISSKALYLKADSVDVAMGINLDIAYFIDAQEFNTSTYSHYINEYLAYSIKTKDPVKMARGYGYLALFKHRNKDFYGSRNNYKKALALIKGTDAEDLEASINNNLANLYNEDLKKPDSGLYYLKKNIAFIAKTGNDPYSLYHNYINQASSYYHLQDPQKAIVYALKADSLPIEVDALKSKEAIYAALHIYYAAVKDYPTAYKYLLLEQDLTDSIKVTDQNVAINDIQTKYQTKEKEWENSVLKNNIKFNNIVLYTFIGLFIACLVIGVLIVMNSKRKEKIALQGKLIEQQRFEKALKDYELSSIDIMLTGQEKERQRIANDLHDNLGSMLATLKLNFQNLKLRKNEVVPDDNKLYEKTDELIEEAYQKVRRIAHAKNAGVFANEGLIPEIKKLAAKVSIPGKLQINVIPFGFTERLDSTFEISIFRAVQELATNIIKHSKATEATIHLTQHDDNINIIFEDDGIGMDVSKTNMQDGMGLHSIAKKIEQLNGTFTIDSTPGRGTTIIIDLPI